MGLDATSWKKNFTNPKSIDFTAIKKVASKAGSFALHGKINLLSAR
jgi:hypothetical protein